jgi:cytosine/adenosine deaminase-related metal-dependent hydrolase
VEASGWLPAIAPQRFQRSFENYSIFSKVAPSALVPHAPYSVSDELWQLIMPFYQNRVVTIHNQETVFEDELFVQNTGDFVRMYEMMKLDSSFYTPSGKSSLQTYFANLSGAASVLLVHNTFTKEADIDFVQLQTNGGSVSFCLCANANKFIEQAVPPVELLRQKQCHIVLGTDSLASNWSLNIVDEMKTIQNSFPNVPVEELLTWVTFNGAKALQMEDSLGSFEQGKQPGVVLLQHLDLADESTLQSTIPKRVF